MRRLGPGFGGYGHGGGGEVYLAIVLHFLAVVVVVAGIVWVVLHLVRALRPPRLAGPPRSPALDELDLRYARGELERAEYLMRRADILGAGYMQPPVPPTPPPVPPAA